MELEIKNKKETAKELRHEDVYYNGKFLGYIIKDGALVSFINKWHFVSKCEELNSFGKPTREEVIDEIYSLL